MTASRGQAAVSGVSNNVQCSSRKKQRNEKKMSRKTPVCSSLPCAVSVHILDTMKKTFQIASIVCALLVAAGSVSAQTPASGAELSDLAQYFAGIAVPAGSPLAAKTQINGYAWFKSEMQRYWQNFKGNTFGQIRVWQVGNASDLSRQNVLYPFAGADFLNVYAVYPDAGTYVMIGLEKGGVVPNLETMPEANIRRGLSMMVEGFRIYIGFNFYRTLGMEVDLNMSPFTGTLPHVLTQVAWLGLKPKAAHAVRFSARGQLMLTPLARGVATDSWALDCTTSNGRDLRIIYVSQDISNEGLARSPGVKAFLETRPPSAGMFKAASYLPPRPAFSEITRICLGRMQSIVQDDSAIPYRMLKDQYKVTTFGWYDRPHALFPSFGQPELAQLYRTSPRRSLMFNFQYDRPDNSRNLMVARRIVSSAAGNR